MITHHSSRILPIDKSFLVTKLDHARGYDRIAGYFSSSIFEVADEVMDTISGPVRVICNTHLDVQDIKSARFASALWHEWCESTPEKRASNLKGSFAKLYRALSENRIEIRVLPDAHFGFLHGKAGVITMEDGKKTSFLASANETYNGWKHNYELLWEDDSPESVEWVQTEFDALWNHPSARPLADVVIEDIERISKRVTISLKEWQNDPTPQAVLTESPVSRDDSGLWGHQKYFVKLAFDAHLTPHGARYILADMVGLGKTIQLAMAAQLVALTSIKPVLILTPKTLIWQWQTEMKDKLDMPSAVWNGKYWVDENGDIDSTASPGTIKNCPRRVGIVPYSLITQKSVHVINDLLDMEYECVVVDEAHHARRKDLGVNSKSVPKNPNNLLDFLMKINLRTKSMLLATATPVQLYPIEAWDMLFALSTGGRDSILGSKFSCWRDPSDALDLVMNSDQQNLDQDEYEVKLWKLIQNPLPFSYESPRVFGQLRQKLRCPDDKCTASGSWSDLSEPNKAFVRNISKDYIQKYNPFIRHIIRRTRSYLESTINPETNKPYLKRINVRLFGDRKDEAIPLYSYSSDAYNLAQKFCDLHTDRTRESGLLRTIMLRRIGSSMYAGLKTAERMIEKYDLEFILSEDDDVTESTGIQSTQNKHVFNLSTDETKVLRELIGILSMHKHDDPKYDKLKTKLIKEDWQSHGCIIFSQYFDTIDWFSKKISQELPEIKIGVYAGSDKSGYLENNHFEPTSREHIKSMVFDGEIKILFGTDAASEGLNLQKLGCLINLDLPWNPTRLEQRKGRIQRIGQLQDEIWVYNMRYRDSVEDRVHELLSDRLRNITDLFGQIPDCLSDVWIDMALGKENQAQYKIDEVPIRHPFIEKYEQMGSVKWDHCYRILDTRDRRSHLLKGWQSSESSETSNN